MHSWFYKWYITYFDWIIDELNEVKEEVRENNSVYLEDELGDVFWDYICMLQSLKKSWHITSIVKVFERCYKKLNERISFNREFNWCKRDAWKIVKQRQKIELKEENDKLYNNI